MLRSLQKLGLALGFIRKHEPDTLSDELFRRTFEHVRSVKPDTRDQWLRLERSLDAQSEGFSRRSTHRLAPRIAFATAAVATVIVIGYVVFAPPCTETDTFTTGRGEQTRIELQDGTEVTLSYSSQLVVTRIQRGKPRVLALSGEAFFHVRRDETPFIVSTNVADVQVLGTKFNVRAREGTTEVVVTSGRVNVRPAAVAHEGFLLLTENQMVRIGGGDASGRIREVPSPEYPGWRHGKLFFDRTPFEAACRELEMRFDVTITVDERKLRGEVITGVLDARTPDSALTALCGLVGKQFSHEHGAYRVY